MRKVLILFFISLCLVLLFALPCLANSWRIMSGDETIEKGQVIESDLLFSGDRLLVNGEIKGDLIVSSGQVIVNGKIDGSILGAVWDKLTINGIVQGNIRGLANEIRINGQIKGCLTVVTAQLSCGSNSLIEKGFLGAFSKVDLKGRINGPVDLNSALSTQIGGQINNNLKAQGAPISWQAPLKITGTVNDYSGTSDDPAKIKGITIGQGYHLHQPQPNPSAFSGVMAMIAIVWFIGSLLATLILNRLFPRTLWMITEPSSANFRRSILVGLIGIVGIPILILILILTLVGIPLAVLLGLFYLILLFFAGIPINLWFGRLVFKSRFHPSLMITLAGLILLLFNFIPIINLALQLIFICLGCGMILSNIRPQIYERKKLDLKI